MNIFIIAFTDATRHHRAGQRSQWRWNMKFIFMTAIASAVALSAIVFTATPGAAKAGPIVPPGRYCLSYDEDGTDCSFTSDAQCQATASGIGAECYGPSFRDERSFRNYMQQNGETQFQAY
jgi:hypothetical protein